MSDIHHFTRFLLLRHAQARSPDGVYGHDTPLSGLGEEQARLLGAHLKPLYPLSAIYCSPYPRARQTAAPLAERVGLPVHFDERLAEFDLDPAPLDSEATSQVWKPEDRGRHGGESVSDFFGRVARFCEGLCTADMDQTVVLVTHAGVIDAVYRWATGAPPEMGWNFEVDVPNASVSVIEMWPDGRVQGGASRIAVLGRIGDVSHLGERVSAL
jgi:broad specificity phosphatase PhoE